MKGIAQLQKAGASKGERVWRRLLVLAAALLLLGGCGLRLGAFKAPLWRELLRASIPLAAAGAAVLLRRPAHDLLRRYPGWSFFAALLVLTAAGLLCRWYAPDFPADSAIFPLAAGTLGLPVYREYRGGCAGVLRCAAAAAVAAVLLGLLSASAAAAMAICGLALLLFAAGSGWFGSRRRALASAALCAFAALCAYALTNSSGGLWWLFHRAGLLWNPAADPMGAGFMPLQIRRALASATVFGAGTETCIFPLADGSGLLPFIACRFGMAALAAVIALFVLAAVSGFALCRYKSGLSRFMSFALACAFALASASAIAGELGWWLIPLKGLPLLGGSVWTNTAAAAALGIAAFGCDRWLPEEREERDGVILRRLVDLFSPDCMGSEFPADGLTASAVTGAQRAARIREFCAELPENVRAAALVLCGSVGTACELNYVGEPEGLFQTLGLLVGAFETGIVKLSCSPQEDYSGVLSRLLEMLGLQPERCVVWNRSGRDGDSGGIRLTMLLFSAVSQGKAEGDSVVPPAGRTAPMSGPPQEAPGPYGHPAT